MNETSNHMIFFHGLRQALVRPWSCCFSAGWFFPSCSAVFLQWCSRAGRRQFGLYGNRKAVGAKYIGQEFTAPYFMKGRPSAYHYNTYYEDAQGNQYYSDGSPFGGIASGSNNYAPSNPALTERVEADMEAFLAANPEVSGKRFPPI